MPVSLMDEDFNSASNLHVDTRERDIDVHGWRTSNPSYEQSMRSMYQQRIADFQNNTMPLIGILEEEAQSTDVYDRAVKRAEKLGERVEGVYQRQENYSMDGILPSQKANAARVRQRNVTKAQTAMVTRGSIDARNRRAAARNQLMGIAEQLQTTGSASMTQAYAQKRQREAAYDQARGGYMSQIGAIAGGAIGFMVGGPGGAMVGSSLGGGIGGAVGG